MTCGEIHSIDMLNQNWRKFIWTGLVHDKTQEISLEVSFFSACRGEMTPSSWVWGQEPGQLGPWVEWSWTIWPRFFNTHRPLWHNGYELLVLKTKSPLAFHSNESFLLNQPPEQVLRPVARIFLGGRCDPARRQPKQAQRRKSRP